MRGLKLSEKYANGGVELKFEGFKNCQEYSVVEELTLDILQEFVDKIVVNHREEIMGEDYPTIKPQH